MNSTQFLASLLFTGLSQSQVFAQSGPVPSQQPGETATLHLFQGKAFGIFYPKYRVYANDKLVCKLGRNSHCQLTLPAGATTIVAKLPGGYLTRKPPVLPLTLEAGKSYYLQGITTLSGVIPRVTYSFAEVVPNPTKLAEFAGAKTVQPLAPAAQ
ncbi:hypothetical protein [Hymenobacter sp.]|jgi:hypothetical protein|uniref:hypothetical protein n=1 Tax=Hymenobacter sp. TaxID=1898978 RepID=UPI002ED8F82B